MAKARQVEGLPERLKEVLFARGLSPYEIELITGINHVSIYSYQNGERVPSVYTLGVLAKLCNVTTDYLIYGE